MTDRIVDEIADVWLGHDDFDDGGMPYVAWLIEQDVADMRADDFDETECIEELADVCINAMRMMSECGYSPRETILNRLDDHRAKDPTTVIEEYQRRYVNMATRDETVSKEDDDD